MLPEQYVKILMYVRIESPVFIDMAAKGKLLFFLPGQFFYSSFFFS